MIIFWNTKKLAQNLKLGNVAQKDIFLYFFLPMLVPFFFTSWIVSPVPFPDEALPLPIKIRSVLNYIIMALGISVAWYINFKGDNQKFLERYFCLSFPLSFKVNIFSALFTLLTPHVLFSIGYGHEESSDLRLIIYSSMLVSCSIFFYYRLIYWLRRIA